KELAPHVGCECPSAVHIAHPKPFSDCWYEICLSLLLPNSHSIPFETGLANRRRNHQENCELAGIARAVRATGRGAKRKPQRAWRISPAELTPRVRQSRVRWRGGTPSWRLRRALKSAERDETARPISIFRAVLPGEVSAMKLLHSLFGCRAGVGTAPR